MLRDTRLESCHIIVAFNILLLLISLKKARRQSTNNNGKNKEKSHRNTKIEETTDFKNSAPLKTSFCSSFCECVVHFSFKSRFYFLMRCQQKLLNNLNQNEKCNCKRSEK